MSEYAESLALISLARRELDAAEQELARHNRLSAILHLAKAQAETAAATREAAREDAR